MLLRRWAWPFLWVLLVPAFSVPFSIYLQSNITLYEGTSLGLGSGGPWAARDAALRTFLPGLLNLGVLIWCVIGNGRARWAAIWASIVGAAGALLPFAVILTTDTLGPEGTHYVYWIPTVSLVWLGAFNTWLATLIAAIVFRLFVQTRDRVRVPEVEYEQEEAYLSPAHSH